MSAQAARRKEVQSLQDECVSRVNKTETKTANIKTSRARLRDGRRPGYMFIVFDSSEGAYATIRAEPSASGGGASGGAFAGALVARTQAHAAKANAQPTHAAIAMGTRVTRDE